MLVTDRFHAVSVFCLLLRKRERLRSIVVSMSVCLRGYLRNHMRDLYQICVHVAYGLWPWLCPPPATWRNPKGKGQICGVSSALTA